MLIQLDPPINKQGVIYLPDDTVQLPNSGKVVAVGPGFVTKKGLAIPLDLSVGQTVCFKAHAGNPLEHDGKEYRMMEAQEIYAIL